jgi:hypothetical protein
LPWLFSSLFVLGIKAEIAECDEIYEWLSLKLR